MECSVSLSNLKQKHMEILAELGLVIEDDLALAIWELLKNTEHRPEGTKAKIFVEIKNGETFIITRNPVSPQEIQRHIERDCLPEDDQLFLEDHRGECLIIGIVGDQNYERLIDPWTKEMVCTIHIPTNKN